MKATQPIVMARRIKWAARFSGAVDRPAFVSGDGLRDAGTAVRGALHGGQGVLAGRWCRENAAIWAVWDAGVLARASATKRGCELP